MRGARLASALGLLLALLALFTLRPLLEASMTAQMLLQIPLLVCVGVVLGHALSTDWGARVAPWNRSGLSGLVLASPAVMFWMLPRSLDAAAREPLMDVAKHLSLPLLAGLPIALSWPRAGFVVRGVFLLELVASCFRLGWLYLISPLRLCNNYALDDQRRLGEWLLVIGVALLAGIAFKLLWGNMSAPRQPPGANDRGCDAAYPLH
ncbi:MAG: hypothetical protein ACREVQ_05305 [Burkholderiales bacterium]